LEELGNIALRTRQAAEARIARLDDLVEIERMVAEATGQAFNETQFRALELSRAIVQTARAMFEAGESVETVAATIAPWVEQLEPLRRQMRLQTAANAALEGFVSQLSDGNRVMGNVLRNLRVEGGGLRFDIGGVWGWVANIAGQLLGGLFAGAQAQVPEPRTFQAPDPFIYGLAVAQQQRGELEAELRSLQQRLAYERQRLAYEESSLWNRLFRQDILNYWRERIRVTEREIANVEAALGAFDMESFLGIDAGSIARAVESGFDMADLSRLGESLEDVIRTALV